MLQSFDVAALSACYSTERNAKLESLGFDSVANALGKRESSTASTGRWGGECSHSAAAAILVRTCKTYSAFLTTLNILPHSIGWVQVLVECIYVLISSFPWHRYWNFLEVLLVGVMTGRNDTGRGTYIYNMRNLGRQGDLSRTTYFDFSSYPLPAPPQILQFSRSLFFNEEINPFVIILKNDLKQKEKFPHTLCRRPLERKTFEMNCFWQKKINAMHEAVVGPKYSDERGGRNDLFLAPVAKTKSTELWSFEVNAEFVCLFFLRARKKPANFTKIPQFSCYNFHIHLCLLSFFSSFTLHPRHMNCPTYKVFISYILSISFSTVLFRCPLMDGMHYYLRRYIS